MTCIQSFVERGRLSGDENLPNCRYARMVHRSCKFEGENDGYGIIGLGAAVNCCRDQRRVRCVP